MRLLLLPGMDGTGRLFEPLLAELPPAMTPIVVSYPTNEPLDYDRLLERVEAAAPSEPFVVVGESFSGPLAVLLASRRPLGLRGVVLCASFIRSPLPFPRSWTAAVRPWMFRWQPLGLLSLVLLGRQAFGPLGRLLRSSVRSVSPAVLVERIRAIAYVNVTAELRNCPVPVLYLQARGDWVVGRRSWQAIEAVRPETELVTLPGPHLVLQTSPRQAAEAIAEFCGRAADAS